MQKDGRAVQHGDQEIFAAVVEEVGRGGASGHIAARQGNSGAEADLGEFSVLKITEQKGPLGIGHTKRVLVHLRIHMPVGDENVLPAIVVEIEKLYSKPEERHADRAEAGASREISELTGVIVVVEVV